MDNLLYTCAHNLTDMGKYSKYHGVCKFRRATGSKSSIIETDARPWTAQLIHLGIHWTSQKFATEREAAIAYDRRVLELGLDKPLNILKPKPRE